MGELTTEQIAELRGKIRALQDQHIPMSVIDAHLQKLYGVKSADVMKVSGADSDRAVGQGLTLNHLDELAGLKAKLMGGDYTTARDAVRRNDAGASIANPKTMALLKMLGGVLPGMATAAVPGLELETGAGLANVVRGAAQSGLVGGVSGAGASTENTVGGIAKDAAISGVPSAVLGAAGGVVASRVMNKGLPKGAVGRVSQESAALLPLKTPDEIRMAVARQENLAPGSTVGADLSSQLQVMLRGVGADLKTTMIARADAVRRIGILELAKKDVSGRYETLLKGLTAPVDPEITAAVASTGAKGILPKKGDVALTAIQKLKSEFGKKAAMAMDPAVAYDYGQKAAALSSWLQRQFPAIKALDSDWAFLSGRLKVANKTRDILAASAAAHGTGRAFDVAPGSVGASLPAVHLPGGPVGTVLRTTGKILGAPDKARLAKVVAAQLLTPVRENKGLIQHLLDVHDVLSAPADHSLLKMGQSALFAGAAPAGVTSLAQMMGQQ